MSKNLEQEYKEYIRTKTPDLWDRIEKSLTEREEQREKTTEEKAAEKTAGNLSDNVGERTAEGGKRPEKNAVSAGKKPVRFYVRIGGSLAAAIVVLVVAVPVLKNNLFSGGQSKTNSESSFMMNGADGACEEALQQAGGAAQMPEMQEEADLNGVEAAEITVEEAGEKTVQAAEDGSEEEAAAGLVSLELTIRSIEGNKAEEAVYFAESETGESYSFVLAEDAFVAEEILQEGGILEGNRYAVELVREEEGYRAVAVRK